MIVPFVIAIVVVVIVFVSCRDRDSVAPRCRDSVECNSDRKRFLCQFKIITHVKRN